MAETARAHVVLPRKLLEEIDALVGKRKRSEFIVEVLERHIVNARQSRALAQVRAFAEANPDAGPPEWATAESTAEWVRAGRSFVSDREQRIRKAQGEMDRAKEKAG
jgi:Arc/MetJ-type ribon-helix-helix transcriptional regulator